MKPRTIVPLVVGLAIGFFAIKMGLDMVQRARGAQTAGSTVVVSNKAIDVATRINELMLTTRTVPAALLPQGVFTDKNSVIGRVTAMTIAPGVPITTGMLAPPGAEPGLRAIIPPGHRAVSVSVTEESAVAGFIVPGSRVDVFCSNVRQGTSKLVLSDVEVGAVGQSMSEVGADGKTTRITKSVTLFLEPDEIQVLNAHTGGRNVIRLALRGHAQDPAGPFWSGLFKPRASTTADAMPADPPPRLPHVAEVVRGGERQRLFFDDKGRPMAMAPNGQPVSAAQATAQTPTRTEERE